MTLDVVSGFGFDELVDALVVDFPDRVGDAGFTDHGHGLVGVAGHEFVDALVVDFPDRVGDAGFCLLYTSDAADE